MPSFSRSAPERGHRYRRTSRFWHESDGCRRMSQSIGNSIRPWQPFCNPRPISRKSDREGGASAGDVSSLSGGHNSTSKRGRGEKFLKRDHRGNSYEKEVVRNKKDRNSIRGPSLEAQYFKQMTFAGLRAGARRQRQSGPWTGQARPGGPPP